jgi:hypothetical protein
MKVRAAFLLLVSALVSVPVHAQGRGAPQPPPPKPKDLAAQLAALEARVAKLEGNITAADLLGTYALSSLSVNLNGAPPGDIRSDTIAGTVTVAADGTASGSVTAKGYHLPLSTHLLGDTSATGSNSFTWTYANGVVELSDGNKFMVAAGGRLLIGVTAFNLDANSGVSQILLLTRLQ